jgi:glycosyltransferase involved in cell wall biosynthesis
MQKKELVSILVPNFNKAPYLVDCINSILRQTSDEWSLYVRDDASTDASREVLKQFEQHPKIFISFNKQNLGCAATLNKLIQLSENDIVCYLGSDDALAPTCVEKVLNFYEKHTEACFVYTNFYVCDINLSKQGPGWSRVIPEGQTSLEADCVSALQTFRKSVFARTKGLDESLKGAVDKDLILKLEEVTKPYFLPESLYLYRSIAQTLSRGKNHQVALKSYELAKQNAHKRRGSV